MSLERELKVVARKKAKLAKQEANLQEKSRAQKELKSRIEGLIRDSGMLARDVVFFMVDQFKVRLAGRRKGAGKRRRTKITAELRDAVKKTVKGGASKLAASKQHKLSYAVVNKMMDGHYDKLK